MGSHFPAKCPEVHNFSKRFYVDIQNILLKFKDKLRKTSFICLSGVTNFFEGKGVIKQFILYNIKEKTFSIKTNRLLHKIVYSFQYKL